MQKVFSKMQFKTYLLMQFSERKVSLQPSVLGIIHTLDGSSSFIALLFSKIYLKRAMYTRWLLA